MTATEELRRLLDERGIEWNGNSFGFCEFVTSFDIDGLECAFSEFDDRATMVRIWGVTPAQAVEATLGRRECSVEYTHRYDYEGGYGGTEYEHGLTCGHRVTWGSDDAPDFCPHCGAKVVEQ